MASTDTLDLVERVLGYPCPYEPKIVEMNLWNMYLANLAANPPVSIFSRTRILVESAICFAVAAPNMHIPLADTYLVDSRLLREDEISATANLYGHEFALRKNPELQVRWDEFRYDALTGSRYARLPGRVMEELFIGRTVYQGVSEYMSWCVSALKCADGGLEIVPFEEGIVVDTQVHSEREQAVALSKKIQALGYEIIARFELGEYSEGPSGTKTFYMDCLEMDRLAGALGGRIVKSICFGRQTGIGHELEAFIMDPPSTMNAAYKMLPAFAADPNTTHQLRLV